MQFGLFFIAASRERDHQRDYAEILEQAECAEALGFSTLWVAEHHTTYGTIPSPAVLLGAMAQRTKRIRIGPLISVLPFQNPVRVAEDYAMIDVLSGGRLNFGVGRGNQPLEYAMMRAAMDTSREVLWESIDVIRALWTEGRISYHGKHFQFDDIEIVPRPIQNPVPMWVAAISEDTYPLVAARGLQLATGPFGGTMDEVKARINAARQILVDHGRDPATINFPFSIEVNVAATSEEARDNLKGPFHWMRNVGKGWHPLGPVPKTYEQYAAKHTAPVPDADTLIDNYINRGLLLASDPSGAIRFIRDLEDTIGLKEFVCAMSIGGISHSKVMDSMRRFAEEVIPAFR